MKKLMITALAVAAILVMPKTVFAETYSDTYKKITTDGTLHVKAIEPSNYQDAELLVTGEVFKLLNDPAYKPHSDTCNYDFETSKCAGVSKNSDGSYTIPVGIEYKTDKVDENGNPVYDSEYHTLKVYFDAKSDSSIKTQVDTLAAKLKNTNYDVRDLGYINYIYNIKKGYEEVNYINYALLYSNEMVKTLGNNNISFISDNRAGSAEPWDTLAFGFLVLYYDGVGYAQIDPVGYTLSNIVYVPDDTEDTTDAYIAAALKRINEYFGGDVGFKIETAVKISDILDSSDYSSPITYMSSYALDEKYNGMNNKLDMTYKVTVNGNTFYILIEKDSSKMETPLFGVTDTNTNISISASNGSAPLDASLSATYIEEGTEEYENIEKYISGDFSAVDITLYSQVKSDYVTKLDSGKFLVTIPIPEELTDKEITVYYITSDGELEEHTAKLNADGTATFETDHFSTYVLASPQTDNEDTPGTLDLVNIYGLTLLVSATLVVVSIMYLRKKNN